MKSNGQQQPKLQSGESQWTTRLDELSKDGSSSTTSVTRNDSGYISYGHSSDQVSIMFGNTSGLSIGDDVGTTTTTSVSVPLRIASDDHCDSGLDERFGRLNVVDSSLSATPSASTCTQAEQAVQRPSSTDDNLTNEEASWHRLCEEAFRPDRDGDTYLHLAIVHGRWDIINRLVQLSPHPSFLDFQNNLLQSPLHLAVLVDLPRTVRQLVLSDAALDVRNRVGNTPLHVACELGRVDCVRELLRPITVLESRRQRRPSSQAMPQDLEMRNYEGQMCVHLASIGHHLEVLELLRSAGANMNAREGKSGRTALCLAIEARRWTLVSFLVGECRASVNEPTYAGLTPFQLAYAADPQLATTLLRLGALPTQPMFSDTDDTDSDYGSIADEGMDTDVTEKLPSSKYFDLKIDGEPLW